MTSFSAWYRKQLRPALPATVYQAIELGPTKDGAGLALPIQVLGVAGVGKSTLLNALISDWMPLLPQGGVGSLTSSPVRIVYAKEPYLAIRRQPRRALHTLLTSLRGPDAASSAMQQARLLVQGTQFGDAPIAYLVEMLDATAKGTLAENVRIADSQRLSMVADLVRAHRTGDDAWKIIEASAELPTLRHELERHAAGFLAPLVAEIELGWAVPFLAAGVQLVDLPGLGVAHDVQQQHAQRALGSAQACMIVVDRSGLTEVCATALKPLLGRLLASERSDWSRIIVAVTQLDQNARDLRADEDPECRRSWQYHFDDLGQRAEALVRGQFTQHLAAVGLDGEGHREQRVAIAGRIQVVHVAPLEHRHYIRRDEPTRPTVADEAGSGIPRLRAALALTGASWQRVVLEHLHAGVAIGDPSARGVGSALRAAIQAMSLGWIQSW